MDYQTLSVLGPGEDGVAEVVLRGTGEGNAFGGAFFSELPQLVADLESDQSVRAVVLRGSEDGFSVGLDLRWYLTHYRRLARGGDGALRAGLLAEAATMQQAITSVSRGRLPFVAAVHGGCVGAGLDLVSACDIRLASADAFFSLREIRIGVVADLGSLQRLPRIIGAASTRELALTGRDVPAREAAQLGLLTRVQPDPETLWRDARAVAAQIAAHPPQVVAGVRDVLDRTQDLSLAEGLRYVAVWNAAFLPSPQLPELLAAALRESVREPV
ncbi:enoyl-CoA hydratase-related protein [Amycolatopsis sp. NBC_00345]|uniref:enoyl-CoA hydratase-related protein n=1 Tax=Amycolatopsis sp. NBC_00345 TaxID=2975955 RepID=UPI002E25C83E